MKCQVAWNWRASRTELVVTSQKQEKLDLSGAEWLSGGPSPRLIPVSFTYAHAREKRAVVRYDIMGTKKLSKFIRSRTLSPTRVERILFGLEEATRACAHASKVIDTMLFRPDFVYLDERENPGFIYVPFSGVRYDPRQNTPLVLLAALSDPKRVNWQTAQGESQRDALHRYVLDAKVFSHNDFSRLLDREFRGVRYEDWESEASASVPSHTSRDAEPFFLGDLFLANNYFELRRDDTGEVYRLDKGAVLTMGTSSACDLVVLGNQFMDSTHLMIEVRENGITITDYGTAYGTYAFNRRLAPQVPIRLGVGECFLVGGERFCLLSCEGKGI